MGLLMLKAPPGFLFAMQQHLTETGQLYLY